MALFFYYFEEISCNFEMAQGLEVFSLIFPNDKVYLRKNAIPFKNE